MSKFNTTTARPTAFSPVTNENTASGVTHEGAPGFARDPKSELFLLAVANMVGEQTFYESAGQRDSRYTQLVRTCTALDPDWTAGFLRWLRGEGNMRSASLVGAAEFAAEALARKLPGGRQVIASVLQRADEPAEMLAYWTGKHGRAIPKPVKRGIADAVARLYNERSLLKYDATGKGYRFGDVIDLVHPAPTADWQGALFEHAIDRRHNRDNPIPEPLATLHARAALTALPVEQRRAVLGHPDRLSAAGMTWEALAGWLQGPMDAEAWAAVIPSMGYMALLRNLRNFDEAGIGDDVAAQVGAKLADPAQVARSRQFPLRFLSAYKAAPSLRWAWPLEQAMTHSLGNIPTLAGRTLVLVDTSTSMQAGFSRDGTLMRWDAAAVFGIALASRCASADVVSFSSAQRYWGDPAGANTKVFTLGRGESLLRAVKRWETDGYFLGGGTDTDGALGRHYAGHDRVVILTDEQAESGPVGASIPARVSMYTWNLAGYRHGHAPSGSGNRHTFGGLTDAGFRMIPLLEAGVSATWPWV